MPRPRPTVSPIDASPPAADDWADGALGVKAAAAFAGVSRDTLYELMRAGVLTWSRPGKNRLIARRSLVRWLASHPSGGVDMGPAWVGYALWLVGAGGIVALYVVAAWPYPRHTKRGE